MYQILTNPTEIYYRLEVFALLWGLKRLVGSWLPRFRESAGSHRKPEMSVIIRGAFKF
jgi:hypothetical protein